MNRTTESVDGLESPEGDRGGWWAVGEVSGENQTPRYRPTFTGENMTAEGVVLTESVMVHMLADLDQIITEMELSPQTRSIADWAHMLRHAVKGSDYARQPKPDYPPNVTCVCGDLIHPDQPFVSVEADGGLFHWNADGGGHRADARVS